MQFTPQQLKGYKGYSRGVRIGNWDEEISVEEQKLRAYYERKEKGDLETDRLRESVQRHLQEVSVTPVHEDGRLRYHDRILLRSECTECFLAANLNDTHPHPSQTLFDVCAAPLQKPAARGVWVVLPAADFAPSSSSFSRPSEDGVISFGDHIVLAACDELRPDGNLFLFSHIQTPTTTTRKSHAQEVALATKYSYNCVWKFVHPDPSFRLEYEGEPIPANSEILLAHCKTNVFLASDRIPQLTDFGKEFETMCRTVRNLHKVEDIQNKWYVIGAPPEEEGQQEGGREEGEEVAPPEPVQ